MKTHFSWFMALLVVILSLPITVHAEDETQASVSPACPEGSVYIPHHVAYCDGFSCHTVVEEGRCVTEDIVKTREARSFPCGPYICKKSIFSSQDVCCVEKRPDHPQQYSCQTAVVSCPGNADKLHIRVTRDQTPSES